MKKEKIDNTVIREKIKKGLDLTFKKLLIAKRQTGGVLIFSENGKISKIKASDIVETID
jgi:hypothetical protein